jgi:DNA polymerase-3 subunit delta
MDAILFSALEGNSVKMDKALGQAFEEKHEPIAIIRSLSNHLLRLSLVEAKISQGTALDSAMKQLRPPVFFKAADPFKRQVKIWGINQLAQASSLCLEAERKCKQTGFPPQLICGNLFQNITALSRRQMR